MADRPYDPAEVQAARAVGRLLGDRRLRCACGGEYWHLVSVDSWFACKACQRQRPGAGRDLSGVRAQETAYGTVLLFDP